MLRLIYVILISFPIVLYYIIRSRYIVKHIENYTESQRYSMVQRMIAIMKKNGRIITQVYGLDNLPDQGGYVMYPNHQGKYDALGIISAHERPCTFVIDEQSSQLPFAREITDLLEASRLDKTNPKKQVKTILDVVGQLKTGRRYILFPEGTYEEDSNQLLNFLPGSFKCSVRSKTPIIPVALINSGKVFGINTLKKIKTEVHFLSPLYYEDYAKLTTIEIATLVQNRIQEVLSNRNQ